MKIEIYGISKEIIEIYKDGKPFLDVVFSNELETMEEAYDIGDKIIKSLSETTM